MNTNRGLAAQRLLDAIMDNSPRDEPYHERDCFPCNVAAEVVGSLAAYLTEGNEWFDNPALGTGWPCDMTIAQQAEKIVAHVLHRRLLSERKMT